MYAEMILKRELTDAERRTILSKTGYALDSEIEKDEGEWRQWVGRSDDDDPPVIGAGEEAMRNMDIINEDAKKVFFALKAMDWLPLRTPMDLWIDDGSAAGWRPEKGE